MGEDLVSYLDQQLHAGYSIAQLKGYLLQVGYSEAQIDQALSNLHGQYSQAYYPTVAQQPQDTAAIYEEQMRKMGYSEDQIQAYLQSQGLSQQKKLDLQQDLAHFEDVLARFHISLKTFLILCIGLFCIAAMVTVLIMMSGSDTPVSEPETFEPVVDDSFDDPFEDSPDDGQENIDKEENVTDVTTETSPANLSPVDDPFADPIDDTGPDEPSFDVIPSPQETTTFETEIPDIIALAATDPMVAKQRCQEFSDDIYIDECFYQLTSETDNVVFCSYIADEGKHDRCLLNYAMKFNDFSRCGQYKTDLRKTCEEISGV
jgi:hypothetical protein